ncbi:hypothetical protein IG631_03528 [Alternaria alternata]|nr:hypothetical protein IG631_03528 [Alternaria alternata]
MILQGPRAPMIPLLNENPVGRYGAFSALDTRCPFFRQVRMHCKSQQSERERIDPVEPSVD